MYKAISPAEWRSHLGLAPDYRVDGCLFYGAPHTRKRYEMLRDRLASLVRNVEYESLTGFFDPILPFRINGRRVWFTTAYGGAALSEWLHVACMLGSGINVLLGTCGGLYDGANTHDLIVPTYSWGDESTTRAYEPRADHRHHANESLGKSLAKRMRALGHRVWEGPTVTHQAMLAETWEDVQNWSRDGFFGVEMEAATMFAVSNHFDVPAAAVVRVADNLIKDATVFDPAYRDATEQREAVTRDMFDAALHDLLEFGR